MYKKSLVLLSLFFYINLYSHKLIYMIAPPRTLSTVFLRSIDARGDIAVYNEPCEYYFLKKHNPKELGMYCENLPFRTYEEVKKELLRAGDTQHTFAKDTPYCTYECFYKDESFLRDKNIEFCFLIRDPHASLISLHKVLAGEILDGYDWITQWITYERLYALFKKIKELRGKEPMVISSEDLTAHPKKIMSLFCKRMGLNFKKSMISWPSLENNFNPLKWHDYTSLEACALWHKNAIKSTCFQSCVRNYHLDSKNNPTFIELDESIRSTVTEIYTHYMPFYTTLYKLRTH